MTAKKNPRHVWWGGFVEGRLDVREIDTGFGGCGETRVLAPALFARREDALREYKDVRPIFTRGRK